MGLLIAKPTDTASPTYQADLDRFNEAASGLRILVSTDATNILTATQLTDELILNPIILDEAEREVLAKTGTLPASIEALDKEGDTYKSLVYLTILLLAITIGPKIRETLRESVLDQSVEYSEADTDTFLEDLRLKFNEKVEELNPDEIAPGSGNAQLTRSRLTQYD